MSTRLCHHIYDGTVVYNDYFILIKFCLHPFKAIGYNLFKISSAFHPHSLAIENEYLGIMKSFIWKEGIINVSFIWEVLFYLYTLEPSYIRWFSLFSSQNVLDWTVSRCSRSSSSAGDLLCLLILTSSGWAYTWNKTKSLKLHLVICLSTLSTYRVICLSTLST